MRRFTSRADWPTLILAFAIYLGVLVRFIPTTLACFAVNDGGMFAVMIDDLRANHYLIPEYTTYNLSDIPFAYPPLAFYLGGIVVDLFATDSLAVVRWLPAIFASFSIPLIYLVADKLLDDKYLAALSAFFFALTPNAYSWFVMGGGLTRGAGQLFMLLAIYSALRLYKENRKIHIFYLGIFCGMAVLSHPEAAVHTIAFVVFFWLMVSRKKDAFVHSVFAGALTILVTFPWWGSVLANHGVVPFLNAAETSSKWIAIIQLLPMTITGEPYATIIAVFALIGIAGQLVEKNFLLPLWLILPFIIEGRSAHYQAIIPLAILAAVGFGRVIMPALQTLARSSDSNLAMDDGKKSRTGSKSERWLFVYLVAFFLLSTIQFGYYFSSTRIYPEDREAMTWVRENSPINSRFLVITGTSDLSCDPVLEWFPAITKRQSIFTVQGAEWIKGAQFNAFVGDAQALQNCYAGTPECLGDFVDTSVYDFVYFSKALRTDRCRPVSPVKTAAVFDDSVRANSSYEIVYENTDVLIFQNK